jgi:drug/metabolite transporter (DMT)-like permease
LLTFNRPGDETDRANAMYGYVMVIISSIIYGCLFVLLRMLNLYRINLIVSPLYFGIGSLTQNIIILLFFPHLLHFNSYDTHNLLCLMTMGIASVVGQLSMITANKYAPASKMSAISYLENVFTILADIFIFSYHFEFTDVLGITIIVVCLVIPVLQKLKI